MDCQTASNMKWDCLKAWKPLETPWSFIIFPTETARIILMEPSALKALKPSTKPRKSACLCVFLG